MMNSEGNLKKNSEVLVFFADGFEEIEAIGAVDNLRRGGLDVATVSITDKKEVVGAHGVTIVTDTEIDEVTGANPKWIVLPGGMPGAENLHKCVALGEMIERQNERGGHIAAICAARAVVLAQAGLMDGRRMTCYPGFEGMCGDADVDGGRSVVDGNFVTANGPSSVTNMCYEILKIEKGGDTALDVLGGMLVDTDKGDFSL